MPIFVNRGNISSITLSDPQPIQGGSYFSKIIMTGAKPDETIYIQTPKCVTKDGVVKTEKRLYSDLLFKSTTEEHSDFMDLMRTIEMRLKECIYARRELWFQTAMDADDIEYYFNSPIKPHKKDDYSVRVFIVQPKKMIQGASTTAGGLVVYDDEQNDKTMDDIIGGKPVIGLLQLRGIKFTNSSLHLEILLSQTMIFKEVEEPKFLITRSGGPAVASVGSAAGGDSVDSVKTEGVTKSQQSRVTERMSSSGMDDSSLPVTKSTSTPAVSKTDEITEIDDFSEEEVDESPVTLKNPKTVYMELYKTLLKRASRALRLYQKEIMDAEKFRRTHGIQKIDIADIIEEEELSGEYDSIEEFNENEIEYDERYKYDTDANVDIDVVDFTKNQVVGGTVPTLTTREYKNVKSVNFQQ